MSTILDTIASYARVRVEKDREKTPLDELKKQCRKITDGDESGEKSGRFLQALSKPGLSFICEGKKASPSKGIIAEDFPYLSIAKEYESAGADAISCLTEPKWFSGSDEIFCKIRNSVKTPMIRKDFVVDEYQIYQAKTMGADAILLICAILDDETLKNYYALCRELGLDALVEAHDEAEIKRALDIGAKIIGVNNRNLKDFSVDTNNSARLRELVPDNVVFVSESGVKTADDIRKISETGADAVLVGEALMRSADKAKTLSEMRRAAL